MHSVLDSFLLCNVLSFFAQASYSLLQSFCAGFFPSLQRSFILCASLLFSAAVILCWILSFSATFFHSLRKPLILCCSHSVLDSFLLCISLLFSAVFLGSLLQSVAPCQIPSFSVVQKWPYSFHAVCIQVQISRKPKQNKTMNSDSNNFIIKHKNQECEMLQYAPSLTQAHKIAINR